MNNYTEKLQNQGSKLKVKVLKSEEIMPSVDNPAQYSELSTSGVREKLSSTRQLLEQTLNKKNRSRGNYGKNSTNLSETETNIHNELKKPDFEQLNHIYENYMKVPAKQKIHYQATSCHRSSSAPAVWQKTKEKLLQEKEEKFKKDCTFKPNINKIPQGKNLDYVERKFNREEWFKKLTRPKNEIIEQRERQKREKEEEDSRNCSFRPTITSFRSMHNSSQTPVEERLYNNSENKQLKREQLKREKEDQEASSFPFSPQVSESTAAIMNDRKFQLPLYQRLEEVQQERNLLRKQAREEKEKNDNLSFRPFVSPKSKKLAENKCSGNIIDRLSRDSSRSKDRFNGTSASVSVSFTSTSSKPYNATEFIERQQKLYEKSQQKKVPYI